MNIIQNLPNELKEARQCALLGNYDAASIYFEGSIQQIIQCVFLLFQAMLVLASHSINADISARSLTRRRGQSGIA